MRSIFIVFGGFSRVEVEKLSRGFVFVVLVYFISEFISEFEG